MSSKRKHSYLWTHFTEDADKKKAKCNYCSTLISIAGGSNGNLTRHMKTKHALIPLVTERQPLIISNLNSNLSNQITTEMQNSASTSSNIAARQPSISQYVRRPAPVRKVEQIDRQVVKMVAKGHHALRIVEETEMRKLIELVSHCPGYQLPSRKTLSENLILKVHEEVIVDVKNKVQAVSALSLSTDGWTSRNNDSYIAIVAHFIDENTKLQSALLSCINYNERHTSQNLCDFIKGIIVEWQISHKVSAIISDNAANILSAVRLGEWRSIGCFAHSLNRVVQHATSEIADVITRVKNIVEFFHRSTQGQKKLQDTQRQMNLPVLKLKQDVKTRWNSTFDMLQRIVQTKDALIAAIALLRSDIALTQLDWEIIEGVLPLLKPFYEVTVEISAEKNVTLSKVIVFCNLLKNYLQKNQPSNNDKVVAVQTALKRGIDDRFKDLEYNVLYAECTILDPRFRKRVFRNHAAGEAAIQGLRHKLGRIQLVDQDISEPVSTPNEPSASSSISGNVNKNDSIWDEYDMEINRIIRPDSHVAAGIRELDKYLNEEYLDRRSDPLQWWHSRRTLYPRMYTYMLRRFCIVATSVPCERIFSATGQILSERRSLLSANKVSKLIFLHNNL